MITVTLCHGKNEELLSCTARGHAEYAKKGCDIVCAASSILMRTLILDLDEKSRLHKDLYVEAECQEKGNMSVYVCECTSDLFPYLSFLFSFLKKGFESLSFEYPENVKLEIVARD